MDPNAPDHPADPSKGEGIDIKKILLPTKEVHTPASAQRINAGVLLEQEQTAAATPPPSPAPAPTPSPKKEELTVQPLETYKGDIEKMVQDKNVSVVSIAAAEAERRAAIGEPATDAAEDSGLLTKWLGRIGMIIGGLMLLSLAAGLVWYFFVRSTAISGPATTTSSSPFIAVDGTQVITITPNETRSEVMTTLEAALQSTSLSLGLIERLMPAAASTTVQGQILLPMGAQAFLSLLAPDIPPDLLLTIQPSFLLGIHVYNGNQPLLILSVDSYEQAYAGMLAWESTMPQDLAPLFNYTPSPHIPEQGVAATTATTSDQFIQTGFVDAIVENHDARVLENSTGDIYFLWTFLDRNTIVITTNDATLREIISRLQNAPITPIPGQ